MEMFFKKDLTRLQIENLTASEIRSIDNERCKLCGSIEECESKTVRECKDILLEACGADF